MTGNIVAVQDLIEAAEARILEIRAKAEVEIGKIRSNLAEQSAKLEGYIQGIKDATRANGGAHPQLLPPSEAPKTRKTVRRTRRRANSTPKFRQGSLPDRVRAMVLKSKKPIHLSEVVKQLGRGGKRVALQSVENRISALARKSHTFIRTGARTYGLIEMGHAPK